VSAPAPARAAAATGARGDTPIVAMSAVHKSYDIGTPIEAEVLHGIDLVLARGEFAAMIGPSGSGKSTLLTLIGLLERPTSGEYRLLGRRIDTLDDDALTRARLDTLGFVFQFHHLIPAFDALENVAMPALIRDGRIDAAARARADALLEAVGLADARHRKPSQLSGGMQQRVAIARALEAEPKVLLLDEPFGALDIQIRESMQDFLHGLWQRTGLTALLITHDLEEALLMAGTVHIMAPSPGRIVRTVAVDLDRSAMAHLRVSRAFLDLREELAQCLRGLDPALTA